MARISIPLLWFTLRIELAPAPSRPRPTRPQHVSTLSRHLLKDIGLEHRW